MVDATAKAPTTAAAVANEFLSLGELDRGFPPIDQMKLQKLLFYAYAWYLAQTGTPLFEENFEAWPWGPVVRNVYYQTADSGRSAITKRITQLSGVSGQNILDFRFETPSLNDGALKSYVRSVWDTHKELSGIQLSNATHLPGEPWTIVKDHYGNLDNKPTIPNDLIEAVFKSKLSKNVSGTRASSSAS